MRNLVGNVAVGIALMAIWFSVLALVPERAGGGYPGSGPAGAHHPSTRPLPASPTQSGRPPSRLAEAADTFDTAVQVRDHLDSDAPPQRSGLLGVKTDLTGNGGAATRSEGTGLLGVNTDLSANASTAAPSGKIGILGVGGLVRLEFVSSVGAPSPNSNQSAAYREPEGRLNDPDPPRTEPATLGDRISGFAEPSIDKY